MALEVGFDELNPMLRYVGRVVMDRCLLPPYVPRKALDRKSFPVHDACTYVFSLEKLDMKAACGPGDLVVRVTRELVQSIRAAHLQQATASTGKRKHR